MSAEIIMRRRSKQRRKERIWLPALYLAPTLLLMWAFDIYPIFLSAWMSLWRWGIKAEEFIGLDNYKRVFEDIGSGPGGATGEVGNSLLVTAFYVIGTVPVTIIIAFVIANMLNSKIRFSGILRTAYFVPYVTSTVAAGLAFVWLLNPQIGVLNSALESVGLPPQQWLLDPEPAAPKVLAALGIGWSESLPEFLEGPSVALVCVIAFSVWNSLGFAVVIILAGLITIDPQVKEAARMDGVNSWQMATRITMPLVSPTLFLLLIVSTISAFQSFNEVYVLTSGGGYGAGAGSPLDSTLTLPVLIFRHLYERPSSVGFAAALSMLLFVVVLGVVLLQFRLAERRVHYE
ncbi:carbohydrate ABC transporter permease [Cryobacterium sp. Y57]|uniref:carbohydrate ABC transporter permease n=1 Tax=Cryobacterium sp. Y57 TaxID=2048287 RepID=UPI000CE536D8|nr:sugar ABC transporter permease [Cryobacterium sp. Y57]